MPLRRKSRPSESQLAFEAIAIEGGLLSPDWLARAAQLQAGSQSESDYRVPRGLNLRDEIGRYWRIAQAHWSDFAAGRASQADPRALAERFVTALLQQSFGFGSLAPVSPVEIAGRVYPIGYCAVGRRAPVIIAHAGLGLDTPSTSFGDGGRRRTAFGLAQEYLNATDEALWCIATDGVTLRILRDNASLTRPAWIEADLARIFTEERYADFAALWLLAHETRFGRADRPARECALESWREAGREEGTRAREHLRRGVEEALLALGEGFLNHPDNGALRNALHDGALSTQQYFQQLLRLVYRLIFLITAEERGLLHPEGASEKARVLYAEGYSLRRLRERATRRSAHDRFADLWEGLKVVFRGLARGEERLGLPALAGIFAVDQCAALDGARLENRALSWAIFRLTWLREEAGLSRVNWRDMGPEELGSVYESLLELVPQVRLGGASTGSGRGFGFATGGETRGNARKLTGSYYTPDSLVQVLLDSALEPVVAQTVAGNPGRAAEALLELSVVDPACGSGHFLLAAARRLATHVARARANGTPTAGEYRQALREVVGRCIYGVDLNPMAVELCKVALWMEAVNPGKPLSFLDSHVQHGNALLGATRALMAKGVPDGAWEAIEGDEKKVASALKKRNKQEGAGQRGLEGLWAQKGENDGAELARAERDLDAASDESAEGLAGKERRWAEIRASRAFQREWLAADGWCAAFVWPKQAGEAAEAAPTNDVWRRMRDGEAVGAATVQRVRELAGQYRFFHWELAFAPVFERGGFDVVLGNPPWERVKLQEQEFFASRSEAIAGAANAAARKKLIAGLEKGDPALWKQWVAASREAEGQSHFVRQSGRYPLCGKGDVNTYALFAEHNRAVLGPKGRAGFIVPTGIATDDTTKEYFGALVEGRELARFYSFENEEKVFPGVHNQFKFALMTLERSGAIEEADLLFFARQVAALADHQRHFSLAAPDFQTLNPNTGTCPTFRSRRDADLNLSIYRRCGVLIREVEPESNPWGVSFLAMLHMANDSGLFRTAEQHGARGSRLVGNTFETSDGRWVPLVEAKMVHLFDHRFSTYEGATEANLNKGTLPRLDAAAHRDPGKFVTPEYWVSEIEVADCIPTGWKHHWFVGWRDVTRSVDERTLIASLIPRTAVNDKFPLILAAAEPRLIAALYANICSFLLDYCARQKVGGASLKFFTMRQLPILPPTTYAAPAPWSPATPLVAWILPRVLELTYTAWDLEPFARDVGYTGPPFRWDPERRFLLRAELDAAFFHLYGLTRDDTAYVLDTFPIVRKNDEKAHGHFRTQRAILEIYDALAESTRRGTPYATRLDPPPADPRVAHPDDPARHPARPQPAPALAPAAARPREEEPA